MKKKILIFITVIVSLILGGYMLYSYFGGFPIGLHKGRLVIRQYFCTDLCPQNGGWHEEYYGVNTKEECEEIGGRSYMDHAWGGFVGCIPERSGPSSVSQEVVTSSNLQIGENITVTGTVIENNKSCIVDAHCILKIRTNQGEIDITYGFGRSIDPATGSIRTCANEGIENVGLKIESGKKIEVSGKVTGENSISLCDSKDFYIKESF